MFKSGFITVVGRPNVGKSTLINHLMNTKLSIVSNKPQTTRKNLNAILTDEESQIVFVDTPGMHKAKNKLGQYMVNVAKDSLSQVDVVIFITTASGKIHPGDEKIMEELRKIDTPIFLVVNKIDEYSQ
ncbi:MAG: GTPase Era, partial [Clostridium sp.]|nr:GTPase Era [Clostridium sp.]